MDTAVLDMGADPRHVIVGVGEIACAFEPQVLITQALGSCIGLTLWDPRLNIGGMAHVMLPAAPRSAASAGGATVSPTSRPGAGREDGRSWAPAGTA